VLPIVAAVVNGLVAPPLIAVLALIAGSRQVMGRYRSGRLSTVLVWFACLGMAAAALGLVISVLKP
jgi:Mn2+/Fe2+ NRAMP family transporter